MDESKYEALLTDMTAIASMISGCSRVAITMYDQKLDKVFCLANTVGGPKELDGNIRFPLISAKQPIVLLDEKQYNIVFENHPFRSYAPHVKSLACYLIHEDKTRRWVLSLANPSAAFVLDDQKQAVIEVLSKSVYKAILNSDNTAQSTANVVGAGNSSEQLEVSLEFLLETLPTRQRLLSRNDINYIAVRTWRKPIKEFQIKAMQAIKNGDVTKSAEIVAKEMAAVAQKHFGPVFDYIVPVPSGSSQREYGLSTLLGQSLAQQLNVGFEPVLVGGPVSANQSHPKKSASLRAYQVKKTLKGRALLVDDIATSGRHLELAHAALMQSAQAVNAMAWIAA
jgi:predicted amidophosphoribosyltransferase